MFPPVKFSRIHFINGAGCFRQVKTNDEVQQQDHNYNLQLQQQQKELVFCYRNRPFAVLQSSFLPTPTSTYIDHQLVMELGMKMSEVSCKKISFAGKKLRLLGRVSFSAQCVNNGSIFGSYHFKASVKANPILWTAFH